MENKPIFKMRVKTGVFPLKFCPFGVREVWQKT